MSERLVGRLRVGAFTHVDHLIPLASVLARVCHVLSLPVLVARSGSGVCGPIP
ncbi:hypothetical protein [Streptomyces sp. RKCA744]|uniref:hypothetical protein n=1 Tax=Streptomyces sp. RKCA744 TaxID=2959340 RepID=UPI0020A02C9A|nr:hypothetical protein [Streptomyces sp. RKCA744]MCO8307110.1 hypothetical protein [Streptomyces sp. RKCA744]